MKKKVKRIEEEKDFEDFASNNSVYTKHLNWNRVDESGETYIGEDEDGNPVYVKGKARKAAKKYIKGNSS